MSSNTADVIILGLGAMGSAAARQLSARGYRVLGFDQFTPPHTYGSSHGLSRMYRQAYWEDPRYVPLLLRAFDQWKELEAEAGQSLFHVTGGLTIGRAGSELITRTLESAQQYKLPHTRLTAEELSNRYPALTGAIEADPDRVALLEANAGYILPELAIRHQLAQAAKDGAELHVNQPVHRWESTTRGVTVHAAGTTYSAAHLIITAGSWAAHALQELALPLQVTRQVLFWFEPVAHSNDFAEGRLPVFLFEASPHTPMVYGFPESMPGSGVKVALHGSSEVTDPDSVNRKITAADEALMRERLQSTLPLLAGGRLLHAETCLYTMTPDEHFVVDHHPEKPNVTLACGFSGHGFKFTPVIGEVLADLATEHRTDWDIDLFSCRRFRRS